MSHRIGCYWVDWRRLLMGLFIAGGIGAMDPAAALPKNTVVATIAVGDLPQGLAITPNGQTVYVVNSESKDVSVIDTASNTVTASITLASYPGAIAITPDSQTAFVLVPGNSTVAVIATATNTVTNTFTTGGWPELAVSPDRTQLYATDFNEGKVVIIDPGTFTTLNKIDTGRHPF
jgi:YVTN family beta-propeller protein